MKSLQQQINESLILNIIFWIFIIILGFLSWGLFSFTYNTVKDNDSDPNLFINIKLHGILYGFIDWYRKYGKYNNEETDRFDVFDKMVNQLAENEDFQAWCNQPISERKLRDLKTICTTLFDKKQMKIGRRVAEYMFHKYTNKANEITDVIPEKEYKTAEKEIQNLI